MAAHFLAAIHAAVNMGETEAIRGARDHPDARGVLAGMEGDAHRARVAAGDVEDEPGRGQLAVARLARDDASRKSAAAQALQPLPEQLLRASAARDASP